MEFSRKACAANYIKNDNKNVRKSSELRMMMMNVIKHAKTNKLRAIFPLFRHLHAASFFTLSMMNGD